MNVIPHVIDGEETESVSGARFASVDPWTREPYAEVALGAEQDADADTNLSRHLDREVFAGMLTAGTFRNKTIEQGAATSVLVATSPQLKGVGGRYFEDCHEAEVIDSDATDLSDHRFGVAPHALDPGNAERLWDVSESLLG